MQVPQPIRWTPEGVVMLDQRRLPGEEVYHTYTDYRDVANAIRDMVIRGAPAIGLAAAMGVAIGVDGSRARNLAELRAEFPKICETLAQTRPTAVDLFWAIERCKRVFEAGAREAERDGSRGMARLRETLIAEALQIHKERREADEAIGRLFVADLLRVSPGR